MHSWDGFWSIPPLVSFHFHESGFHQGKMRWSNSMTSLNKTERWYGWDGLLKYPYTLSFVQILCITIFSRLFFFSISSKARCFLLFKIMLSSSARQLPPPHVWVAFVNSPIVLSMHLWFIFVHIQTTVGWVFFFSKKLELTGMDFVLTTRLLSFPYYYLV